MYNQNVTLVVIISFIVLRFGLSQYLLTPVLNPVTRGEEMYNQAHKRTRQVIERAFGVAKLRFRCIHKSAGELMYDPLKCCQMIVVCFILHNICTEHNMPLNVDDNEDENGDEDEDANIIVRQVNVGGVHMRRQLILQRFQ